MTTTKQTDENDSINILSCLKRVHDEPDSYSSVPSKFRKDREFVIKAVKKNPNCFKYLEEEYQHDKEIIILSLKLDGWLLQFVPDKLKEDEEIITSALKSTGYAYKFLLPKQKENLKYIKMAIEKRPDIFGLLDSSHKSNREVILAAIEYRALISHLSNENLQDFEFMEKLLRLNPHLFQYFPIEYKKNRKFCILALELATWNEESVEIHDEEMLYKMIDLGVVINKYQFDDKLVTKEMVYYSAEKNGLLLFSYYHPLPVEFENDEELHYIALKKNIRLGFPFGKLLSSNDQFVLNSLDINPNLITSGDYCWISEKETFVERALKKDGHLILNENLHQYLENRNLVLISLLNCSDAEIRSKILKFTKFQKDVELCRIVMGCFKNINDIKINDIKFNFK